ncbi:MAG: DUF4956 domain-containing protein [Magnetococcales bacterium]|nr:DUF4956 domain-containing protein [Magnetococcales bacterium]
MDAKLNTFSQYLVNSSAEISLIQFVVNIAIVGILTLFLAKIYQHYGNALSNREAFARTFLPVAMTTMLIITIVKSSLALSLGLVGALSIVRFRTAIKEPEELSFMFLSIAIGLGLGADQGLVTIVAFLIIVGALILRSRWQGTVAQEALNMQLLVASEGEKPLQVGMLSELLKNHCSALHLQRSDIDHNHSEHLFLAHFKNLEALEQAQNQIKALDPQVRISFLDRNMSL